MYTFKYIYIYIGCDGYLMKLVFFVEVSTDINL